MSCEQTSQGAITVRLTVSEQKVVESTLTNDCFIALAQQVYQLGLPALLTASSLFLLGERELARLNKILARLVHRYYSVNGNRLYTLSEVWKYIQELILTRWVWVVFINHAGNNLQRKVIRKYGGKSSKMYKVTVFHKSK